MADRTVFHMRLVADGDYALGQFDAPVAIDVVIRGAGSGADRVRELVRYWLDAGGTFSGAWAGIGTGEYVSEVRLS